MDNTGRKTSNVASADAIAPIVFPSNLEEVTDAELERYARLIYDRTGIVVSARKKTLLSNRLRRRLRQTGITDFGDYYNHLKRLPANNPEWDAFLQEITTHETYLFRDEAQWDWLRENYLPDCAQRASLQRPRSLRVWSAACSTGDEAFTVASCIAACLPNCAQWTIRILGTDIGTGAVEQAKTASFGVRAMQRVPEEYRRRFFVKLDDSLWQAKAALRDMVAFRQHNLMDPLNERPFDLVFLKNVLIYFDLPSKKRVVDNVRAMICPGGLLVAGASEGVSDQLKDFVRVSPWLYQKPAK